ncbi:MAG TPA: glutamine-hydrolyzing GMP synthase [Woeseiaceae bacterium]|nr:glutamine-hydrolyzing GMP synthase [Woeseiaceae bacterium]
MSQAATTRDQSRPDIHAHRLLILDFGGQYTQLIARRVRECGVYSEIHPWDMSEDDLRAFAPSGVVLSGGPESVNLDAPPRVSPVVFELGVPVLGICYGMQTMAAELGGKVAASAHREFGYAEIQPRESGLFGGLSDADGDQPLLKVWMSHGDRVESVPEGFVVTASSPNSPLAAMEDPRRHFYGVQFHPEVTHTPQGQRMIERFVHDVCHCTGDWTPDNIVADAIVKVREQVGGGKVLLGLSGGVDSSVVAALLHEAIGDQLVCVFVDHGLLRLNEGDQVMSTFAEHFGVNVIRVNAADDFFAALKGVNDPEEKRKIIGAQFVRIFDEEAQKLAGIEWLAQGTIYPDVIESAGSKTGKAHVIKSHHNVGGLPANMRMSLIEPLRELFKDEVRKIGVELGLPREMVYRHPFPGPGLGVRVLGEVRPEYVRLLQLADNIFIEELRRHDLYDETSQAFAVFLPVRSVGVMGDGRRYDFVVALRAVETVDFMTARWARLPYEFLELVSLRIINEVDGISRVTYDISGKPPATIEWE